MCEDEEWEDDDEVEDECEKCGSWIHSSRSSLGLCQSCERLIDKIDDLQEKIAALEARLAVLGKVGEFEKSLIPGDEIAIDVLGSINDKWYMIAVRHYGEEDVCRKLPNGVKLVDALAALVDRKEGG